jgi:flavin reductase (DIM6/NTAB) family NADH-FMN oxidoreductase RutF
MMSLVRSLFERPAASRNEFVEAMSKIASTVHVVTTDGPHGRAGMTVTAMTSVSADTTAPTLLVCLNKSSKTCQVILNNGVFCVNVLEDGQSMVSDVFAGITNTHDGDRFSSAAWERTKSGSPRLVDPVAAFDCRVSQVRSVGTHQVVIGEVLDVFVAPHASPLLYAGRNYHRLASTADPSISGEMREKNHAYDNAA